MWVPRLEELEQQQKKGFPLNMACFLKFNSESVLQMGAGSSKHAFTQGASSHPYLFLLDNKTSRYKVKL